MNDSQPGHLDPEKLKRERSDVDFGTTEETQHGSHDAAPDAQAVPGSDDPVHQPTSGVTPPAR
jgi:hypothetical protein